MCFTDTDSSICHIQSEDLVGELVHRSPMAWHVQFQAWTSAIFRCQFPRVGKVQIQSGRRCTSRVLQTAFQDVLPIEAWWYEGLSQGEGVPKTFVKQNVRHEQYLDILRYWTKTSCSYLAFRSWNHRNVTRRHEKVCLSCIDNKSPLLPDCVHSGLQTLKYHGRRMRSHASPCKARARGKGRLTVYICVNKNDITWTKTVSFIAHTHTKL